VTNLTISPDIITRSLNQIVIGQRAHDCFINATALCKAAGKEWYGYKRTKENQAFLDELARSPQICGDPIIEEITTGPNDYRGTWVHSQVAIHLAMWCSPAFAVQVTGWVEEWYRSHRNPLETPLQQYHDFLQLIREVKALLEEIGMYEPPDQLRLADTVRNVLLAAHGQLQLPRNTAIATEMLPAERRMWSVGERLIDRGYSPRYASTEDERGHRYLVRIGKIMSRKFQQRHGQPPVKTSRYVDGAIRKVCVYTVGDLDLLDTAIEEVLGAPPATQGLPS
jgi:KilA-N domain